MADKKLTISIATTADTAAVEKTAASLKKVNAETVTITKNQAAMAKSAADSDAANKALFDRLDKLKEGSKKLAVESASVSKQSASAAASAKISVGAMTAVGLGTKIVTDYFREFSETLKTIDTTELERLDPVMAGMINTSKELFSFWDHPIEDLTGITGIKKSVEALNQAVQQSAAVNKRILDNIFSKSLEDAAQLKKEIDSMVASSKNVEAGLKRNSLLHDRADQRTIAVDPSKEDSISARKITGDANEKIDKIDRSLSLLEFKFNAAGEAAEKARAGFEEFMKGAGRFDANPKDIAEARSKVEVAEKEADDLKLELNRARTKAMQETEIVVQEASKGIEALALKGGESITAAAQSAIDAITARAAEAGRNPYPQETLAKGNIEDLIGDATPDAEQGNKLAGIVEDLNAQLDGRDQQLKDKLTGIQTEAEAQAVKHQEIITKLQEIKTANDTSLEVTIGEVEKAKITPDQTQKMTKAVNEVGRSFNTFSVSSVGALASLASKLSLVTKAVKALQRQIDAINASRR